MQMLNDAGFEEIRIEHLNDNHCGKYQAIFARSPNGK